MRGGGLLAQMAVVFASLSLVSIGGANAVLPAIHQEVVETSGWMSDGTFADLFAISQVAPGPNILLISLIGWHVAGLAGLCVATVAIMLPSSLFAFGAGRVVARWASTSWVRRARVGLVPIALGLILASGVVTARAADHSRLAFGLTAITAAFVVSSRRNPLWALAAVTLAALGAHAIGLAP
jgi:chromate transporter